MRALLLFLAGLVLIGAGFATGRSIHCGFGKPKHQTKASLFATDSGQHKSQFDAVLGTPAYRQEPVTATGVVIPGIAKIGALSFDVLTISRSATSELLRSIRHHWDGRYSFDGSDCVVALEHLDGQEVNPPTLHRWQVGPVPKDPVEAVLHAGILSVKTLVTANQNSPDRITFTSLGGTILNVPRTAISEGRYHTANHTGIDEIEWNPKKNEHQIRVLSVDSLVTHSLSLRVRPLRTDEVQP